MKNDKFEEVKEPVPVDGKRLKHLISEIERTNSGIHILQLRAQILEYLKKLQEVS